MCVEWESGGGGGGGLASENLLFPSLASVKTTVDGSVAGARAHQCRRAERCTAASVQRCLQDAALPQGIFTESTI